MSGYWYCTPCMADLDRVMTREQWTACPRCGELVDWVDLPPEASADDNVYEGAGSD